MAQTVDLTPGSCIIDAFASNAHTVTCTFANGFSVGVIADWTVYIAESPTSTHLYDIIPTSLVGQVLTFIIPSSATTTLVNQSKYLYVAKTASVVIAPIVNFNDTPGTPTTSSITVAAANAVALTISIVGPPGPTQSFITQSTKTADYTLVLADAGLIIEMNSASPNTLTVPTNASVAFPIGTLIYVTQLGAGATTIAPVSGTVTVNSLAADLTLAGQYAEVRLRKRATNEWVVTGGLT